MVRGIPRLKYSLTLSLSLDKPRPQSLRLGKHPWFVVTVTVSPRTDKNSIDMKAWTEPREAPGSFVRTACIREGTPLSDIVTFKLERDNFLYTEPTDDGGDDTEKRLLSRWSNPGTRIVVRDQRVGRLLRIATNNLEDRKAHEEGMNARNRRGLALSDDGPMYRSLILRFPDEPWAPDLHVHVDFQKAMYLDLPRPMMQCNRPGVDGMMLVYPARENRGFIPPGWRIFEFKIDATVVDNLGDLDDWEEPRSICYPELSPWRRHNSCIVELSCRHVYKTICLNKRDEGRHQRTNQMSGHSGSNRTAMSTTHTDVDEGIDYDPDATSLDLENDGITRRGCLFNLKQRLFGDSGSASSMIGGCFKARQRQLTHGCDQHIRLTPLVRTTDRENVRKEESMVMAIREGEEEHISIQVDVYNVRSNGRIEQIGIMRASLGFILDQMEGKLFHVPAMDTIETFDPVTTERTGRTNRVMRKKYQEEGIIGTLRISGIKEEGLGGKHVTVSIEVDVFYKPCARAPDTWLATRRAWLSADAAEQDANAGIPQTVQYVVDRVDNQPDVDEEDSVDDGAGLWNILARKSGSGYAKASGSGDGLTSEGSGDIVGAASVAELMGTAAGEKVEVLTKAQPLFTEILGSSFDEGDEEGEGRAIPDN